MAIAAATPEEQSEDGQVVRAETRAAQPVTERLDRPLDRRTEPAVEHADQATGLPSTHRGGCRYHPPHNRPASRRRRADRSEHQRRWGSSTVKTYPTANIRNVALVGHSGSGKTTLVEALLARSGATPRLGRVEDGTTVSDTEPEEIKRRISALARPRADRVGRLQDQPDRHPRLRRLHRRGRGGAGRRRPGRVRRRARSTASRSRPRPSGTAARSSACPAWCSSTRRTRSAPTSTGCSTSCGRRSARASPRSSCPSARRPRSTAWPTSCPTRRSSTSPTGSTTASPSRPTSPTRSTASTTSSSRRSSPATTSSSSATCPARCRRSRSSSAPWPTRCWRARSSPSCWARPSTGVGIDRLADFICEIGPSPADRPVTVTAGDQQVEVTADEAGQPLAYVFRTIADPFVGQLSLFKVLSGTIKTDDHLVNVASGGDERLHGLFHLRGKEQTPAAAIARRRHRRRRQAGQHPHRRHAGPEGLARAGLGQHRHRRPCWPSRSAPGPRPTTTSWAAPSSASRPRIRRSSSSATRRPARRSCGGSARPTSRCRSSACRASSA